MKKVVSISIFVILAGLVVAGAVLAAMFFTRPMAEPLKVEVKPAEIVKEQPAAAQKVDPTPVPEGVCGLSGTMNVIFTGADFAPGVPPLGADSVRFVRYDFSNQKISIVAFPRDLWVKTEALKEQNRMHERLGLSYHYKKQAATGSEKDKITAATSLLAQVLYDNFQVLPDHYLTLQLSNIAAMVDAVGGVEINLPASITTERKVTFPAGTQTLDGALAAEFIRAYEPGGDAARLKRQNQFVKALRTRVLDAGVVSQFPTLLTQFNEAIVTDLSPSQLTDLACAMEKIPNENIKFYEIEGDMVTAQKDGALIPVWGKIKPMLEEVFGGKLN